MDYAQVRRCIPFPENRLEHPFSSVHLGLIAFRVWRTSQQIHDARMGGDLKHILVIIIESGLYGVINVITRATTISTSCVLDCIRCSICHRPRM